MHHNYCWPVERKYIAKITIDVEVRAVDEDLAKERLEKEFRNYWKVVVKDIKEKVKE